MHPILRNRSASPLRLHSTRCGPPSWPASLRRRPASRFNLPRTNGAAGSPQPMTSPA
uniref:Uncharacterized protein n=1 Tax=uncultured marine virus TaxID=186617 RepID=A0A0F7L8B7_9VIRU|nr:hypothetical protein [uncultured marine virus]